MRRNLFFVLGTVAVILGSFAATLITNTTPTLGLDLQGGISITLEPKGNPSDDALTTAVEVIRNRVDSLGIAEPDIRREGDNIVIDLPGVDDADRARDLVGQTAELRFRQVERCFLVVDPADLETTTTTAVGDTTTTAPGDTTTTAAGDTTTTVAGGGPGNARPAQSDTTSAPATTAAPGATVPVPPVGTLPFDQSGCEVITDPALAPTITTDDADTADATVVLASVPDDSDDAGPPTIYQLGPTIVTGKAISAGETQAVLGNQGWEVNVDFTSEGSAQWNAMAAALNGQQPPTNRLAIVLDHEVISSPSINESSYDGSASISGNFDEAGAKDLARLLRFGALPIELTEASVSDISPTLGSDQLTAGIVAGVIGVGLVFLYLIFFYRILGVVACMGVTLSFIATWVVTSIFGAVLTLAGVVGLIVSVGVTVDSYIVYFERLKDEVRKGKTVRSSLAESYKRSWSTIITADLVSLIGAGALYFIAVGGVRGFAFFLGLSTLLDLIVSYTFMYPLVALMCRRPGLIEARWIGIGSGLDTHEHQGKVVERDQPEVHV